MKKYWEQAVKRARDDLGANANYLLKAEEHSIAFKYAFSEEDVTMDRLFELAKIPPTHPGASKAFEALKKNIRYQSRILQIAHDHKSSEALAPDLLIYPEPVSTEQLFTWMPGVFFHGVVCTDMHLFVNEFYALAADAFTFDSSTVGRARFNLIGLKDSWIDNEGRATRAILVDFEKIRLIETDLLQPQEIHSAQFISLGRDEIDTHRILSERLNCVQINPFKVSWIADNKIASYKLWESHSIPTPDTLPINSINQTAIDFVKQHKESILKPNFSTGGRGATFLNSTFDLHRSWDNKPEGFEWILQSRKDTVLFRLNANNKPQTLVLRLNVSGKNPSSLKVESAYAQIGRDRNSPASTFHGGKIISKHELEGKTGYIKANRWCPVVLDEFFWSQAYAIAEQAAIIYQHLLLAGIDLIINVNSVGYPECLVLECNPRPGGLCRSLCIIDNTPKIGNQLWRTLDDAICNQQKD